MLYLFNTTIMPNEGVYVNRKISLTKALGVLNQYNGEFVSAIGHQGSADIFTLLEFGKVEVNRIAATMKPGDQAICLKLNGRIAEGVILNLEELFKVGYEFYHVTCYSIDTLLTTYDLLADLRKFSFLDGQYGCSNVCDNLQDFCI